MAELNSWQKITRVIPGKPFGDGSDGSYSSATIPTITYRSCSGTATSTTLTIGSSGFSDGDLVKIHQTRGTGVGQWEINKIASGGGTTTLTLATALQYTYTDSGASQAQVIKIPQYSDVTVQSGTWTVSAWGGDTGGILPIACKGTFTVTGTVTGQGKGYVGAAAPGGTVSGRQGEGTSAAGGTQSSSANGSGGGGSVTGTGFRAGAGGGGHSSSGSTGGLHSGNGTPGTGGGTSGSADGTTITFGGAGGSGVGDSGQSNIAGASGSGIVILFTKDISISGAINVSGVQPSSTTQEGGCGAGAGGHVLIACETASVGTNLITSVAGTGGVSVNVGQGGASSAGRITIHHSGTVTGTTNPTFTDVTDSSLVESGGSFFAIL